jgi:hypothetical protein
VSNFVEIHTFIGTLAELYLFPGKDKLPVKGIAVDSEPRRVAPPAERSAWGSVITSEDCKGAASDTAAG